MTPTRVESLELECCCCDIHISKWERLMAGHTRANKRTINRLVREHLPDLYEALSLNLHNPYNYHKTKTHLILVHSGIEHFLRYS